MVDPRPGSGRCFNESRIFVLRWAICCELAGPFSLIGQTSDRLVQSYFISSSYYRTVTHEQEYGIIMCKTISTLLCKRCFYISLDSINMETVSFIYFWTGQCNRGNIHKMIPNKNTDPGGQH